VTSGCYLRSLFVFASSYKDGTSFGSHERILECACDHACPSKIVAQWSEEQVLLQVGQVNVLLANADSNVTANSVRPHPGFASRYLHTHWGWIARCDRSIGHGAYFLPMKVSALCREVS
jgi:hypothetical protein